MLIISKHRSVMLEILKLIYEDSLLGPILGFKGGTLLYLLYKLPRFSIDLDFDLIDEKKEKQILPKVEKILRKVGDIKDLSNKRFTLFILLSYEKNQRNIKIEISKRNYGSSFELNNYLGIAMKTMIKEDIFANKLMALTTRKHPQNRDVFDTWFLLKEHWDINWNLIEKRLSLKKDVFVKRCLKTLESWPLKHTLDGLGELLDNKMKIWVKKNLIQETIFLLKARFEIE